MTFKYVEGARPQGPGGSMKHQFQFYLLWKCMEVPYFGRMNIHKVLQGVGPFSAASSCHDLNQ